MDNPPPPPRERTAAEIVHDINNELGLIVGLVELATSQSEPASEVRKDLDRIGSAARAVAALIEELGVVEEAKAAPVAETLGQSRPVGTVLVVDDSQTMRQLIVNALEGHGFEIATARNGAEALERIGDQKEIDLLLADVQMPEMSGTELAARARRIRPRLPILFVTGDTSPSIEFEGGGGQAVRKPFAEAELLHAVKSTLHAEEH